MSTYTYSERPSFAISIGTYTGFVEISSCTKKQRFDIFIKTCRDIVEISTTDEISTNRGMQTICTEITFAET